MKNLVMLWVMAFAIAIPVGGLWMAWDHLHHSAPTASSPELVTFQDPRYSSYGAPSFSVGVMNDNDSNTSPVTVHSLTVRFVDERAARVITDVTERPDVSVPGGHARVMSFPAPQVVVNTGIEDRQVVVTVTGWS